jgi:Peptidase A4 family
MASRRRIVSALLAFAALGYALAGAGAAQAATGIVPVWDAGYLASSGPYTSVSASWVQPTVPCTSPSSYVDVLVAFDGGSSTPSEAVGTQGSCASGTPMYYAVYFFSPGPLQGFPNRLLPGDRLTASAVYQAAAGSFTMTVVDVTQGWTASTTRAFAAPHATAEIMVEGPGPGVPLPDFGVVPFTACLIDGASLASTNPTPYTMDTSGIVQAVPSVVAPPTSFSVVWKHA